MIDLTQSFSSITTQLDPGGAFLWRTNVNEPWLQDVDSSGYSVPWHISTAFNTAPWAGEPTIKFAFDPTKYHPDYLEMPYFFWMYVPPLNPASIYWHFDAATSLDSIQLNPHGTPGFSRKIYDRIYTYPNHHIHLFQAVPVSGDILL